MSKNDLTEANYFSPENMKKYLSVSQIKQFIKCESMALAELNGDYVRGEVPAFTFGSYVDIALTGTEAEFEKFKEDNPQMFSSRGATKGELKAEYKAADVMIEKVKNDAYMSKLLSGKHQVIMTGEIAGAPIKIKIDSLLPNAIVDLKTCENIHKVYYVDGNRVSFVSAFDYISQGAIYREIVRQNTGKTLPFFLACVSKQAIPDVECIQIDNEDLDERLEELKSVIPHIQALKNGEYDAIGCGKCAYCLGKKKVTKPISWRDIELY